jgi:integrase
MARTGRADNHEGTISLRKDGRWQAQLQVGGKRLSLYGVSKSEVRAKLEAARQQASIQGKVPEKVTLQTLIDTWMGAAEGSLKPRSVEEYRKVSRVILAHFGAGMLLHRLTPAAIQRFYGQHGGTPRKAMYLHQALRRSLRLAVLWGWIASNPADRVLRPAHRRASKTYWTPEQCRDFLASAEHRGLWPLWATALDSGLRFGELIGLRWTDMDPDRDTLRVERSLQRVRGHWLECSPKTASGDRTVHLGPTGLRALKHQHALQAEWRLRAGSAWMDTGRIFTGRTGGPLCDSTADHALARECARLGLPRISMHAFRHLHASLALQAGRPSPWSRANSATPTWGSPPRSTRTPSAMAGWCRRHFSAPSQEAPDEHG